MARPRPRDSGVTEYMHFSPSYKSFASSLTVCLLLSALILVGLLVKYLLQRSRQSSLPLYLPSWSTNQMSKSPEKSVSTSVLNVDDLFPDLGDPLDHVYYPITSGQMAALADMRDAQAEQEQAEEQRPDSAGSSSQVELQPSEGQAAAYVQFFEDRRNGEMWQRRIVYYDPSNQNVT